MQIDIKNKRIESDEKFRFSLDKSYDRSSGRRCGNYGLIEIFDACKEEDWLAADFNDDQWQKGILKTDQSGSGPRVQPWDNLLPRELPQLKEEIIKPVSVVKVAEVEDQEFFLDRMNLASCLLQDVPLDQEYTQVENAENLLLDNDEASVIKQPSRLDQQNPNQRCTTIILDFGKELTGYLRFELEANQDAIMDIAYGERLIAGRVQPVVQAVNYADRYICKEGRQQHEVYDWKGFRYVQLTFRNVNRPLHLYKVETLFVSYPVEYIGSIQSADSLLDKIWQTGAYTQQLCSHDRFMDCPWREQRQWLGDGRVQLLIFQNAFGDNALPRKFIRDFADSQLPSGMIPCMSFSRSAITDYSLWWIQGVKDLLLFDKDISFTRELIPHISKLLNCFERKVNENSLLENVPGWTFIDWANVGKEGVCAPLNAIYYIALKCASELLQACGEKSSSEKYLQQAKALEESYRKTFWNSKQKLYVDNVVNDRQNLSFSLHTQAITLVAGLHDGDGCKLLQQGMQHKGIILTEPYFSFYLLEALAQNNMVQEGLDFVMDKWGAMIKGDATSFWEEWQVTGTFRQGSWQPRPRSHCHAWSAAPTAWISRYILGIRVEKLHGPLIIAPNPCGLPTAQGVVPSPYGPVHISWETHEDILNVKAAIPDDAAFSFTEPPGYKQVNFTAIQA